MNLFLPKTQELNNLALYLNKTQENLINQIEKCLFDLDYEFCEYEDAGVFLSEIINNAGFDISVFNCFCLKRSDSFIDNVMSTLYLKNKLDDCPLCGCKTSVLYDWNEKGQATENVFCSKCGDIEYAVTMWDKEKKGLDF